MRLDVYIAHSNVVSSRNKARYLIEKGFVFVNDKKIEKASYEVPEGAHVAIKNEIKYVGRGGQKLEEALKNFDVSVEGKRCIDIGASTGGFTDCLLQSGAVSVVSVDSGHDQLDRSLIEDRRVQNVEGFNAKNLSEENFGKFPIVVMDVSFISQSLLYPNVKKILEKNGSFISLIKPQFEVGKDNIGKNGIVKDLKLHQECIQLLCTKAMLNGLKIVELCKSPISGGDGNIEYLARMIHLEEASNKKINIEKVIFEK